MSETKTLLTEQELQNLDYKLKNRVSRWVRDNFNFIQMGILEKVAQSNGSFISEHIRPIEYSEVIEKIWNEYYNEDEIIKIKMTWCEDNLSFEEMEEINKANEDSNISREEFCKLLDKQFKLPDDDEAEDFYNFLCENGFREDTLNELRYDSENYPMWNTCFELVSESETIINEAPKCGFGIITDLDDDLNTILFVAGAGYDFYEAHWTPLFLRVCSGLRDEYQPIMHKYWKVKDLLDETGAYYKLIEEEKRNKKSEDNK